MTETMRTNILTAYEGVEEVSSFDGSALDEYRAGLLERTADQAAFIGSRLDGSQRVVEIGSGNGRLLIDLAQRGELRGGVGLEVSASRTTFANRWAHDLGLADKLTFLELDAMQADLGEVDAALCITSAFAYFDALQPAGGEALLRRVADALTPRGLLVLELYPHPSWRRLLDATDDELRLWHELPADDPWRFYLSRLALDAETGILTHHKTFIHRATGAVDSSRAEHIRLYDRTSLAQTLQAAGFEEIEFYGDWSGRAHDANDELLIAVARRG